MTDFSADRTEQVRTIAARHGFGVEAGLAMLDALVAGRGGMAQFRHAEFGGAGQWMRGGMTMVGDLFDTSLKRRVDGLCSDLAELAAATPAFSVAARSRSAGDVDAGWPATLGTPASSGAQNGMRYAWFPATRRLAIERDGVLTLHDTLDHDIHGAAQQQSASGTLRFESQHGPVDLATLPVVSSPAVEAGAARSPASPLRKDTAAAAAAAPPAAQPPSGPAAPTGDVFAALERLADLHARGILSEAEFTAKKTELLARV